MRLYQSILPSVKKRSHVERNGAGLPMLNRLISPVTQDFSFMKISGKKE
jgi:hypothetical protein